MEPSRGGETSRRSRATGPCSSPRSICRRIVTDDAFYIFSKAAYFSPLPTPRPSSSVIYGEQELWLGRLGSGEFESGWRRR